MPPKRQHPPAGESATVPESRPAVEFATGSAQAFFEAAFALATDGQVVVDPETLKPLLFNDAACVPYGYSREQFATLQIPQVSEPDVPDTMEIVIARLLEFGETRFNSTARTMSGDVRYLHVWARTIDFAGRPAFHAVFRDVTAEHLVQDALRRSHDLLERTGRLASVGGWQIDLATQALHWTPEVYRIHDLEPGTPIAIAEAIDYYAPEARPVIAAAVQAAIDLGTSFDLELPMITARGRRILVRAQGAAERRDGKTTHLHGAFQDVTDRRQGEESRRLQSAALQAAADAIVITDREGTIEWVNEAFSKLTGFSADEAMGRNPRDLVRSGEHPSEFYGELWATIVAGRSWQGELVNRRKDGTTYHEDQTITPILDDAGAITHFVAIKRDITQRLKLEAQLRQSQKIDTVGQLASGIAHDFNNLLTVIIGLGELVIPELVSDDPVRADVVQMIEAGRRAAALTRQLLAFSRRQLLAPTVLDLNTVVTSLEQLLRRLLRDDIEFSIAPAPGLASVKVDAAQMEQVIINLAVNARDAMPDGGQLSMATRNVEIDVEYSGHLGVDVPLGPYVQLSVSDTGIGMDETTRNRIFEPFFTTKPAGKGTGLGLSMVYGIIKQSQGFIWVYSEPGRGSSFRIYLPAVSASADAEPAAAEVGPPVNSETILLVEDNPSLQKLITRMLEHGGFTVLGATSGDEALRLLAEHAPAIRLLLTDVVMPQMSGRAVAEWATRAAPAMKVLYMSGYTDDVVMRHGIADAQMAFINKPFTREALLRKVRAVLDGPPDSATPA